ncbi:hypothetical protein HHSLTHF2_29950 [Vreelandella venusta]|jgi:hypothetical protein|uniref:Uncharacterized protein n=1 Tax=Halomonas hydrothermalis TaxID=115561 RepID=A0A6F8U865_9GAMM|nr:hypothetical protein [Halomonas hydrothermalis]BCB09105.1 hypothetical protein HHSLTHF2_29950 [Halomonas hydrothermalis]
MKYVGYLTTFIAAVVAAVGLSIFSMGVMAEQQEQQQPAKESVDQSSICVAVSDEQALGCPEGGLFLARLVISENDLQNPLLLENRVLNTMALFCDTNFEIEHTSTGVLCVLTHERVGMPAEDVNAIEAAEEQSAAEQPVAEESVED